MYREIVLETYDWENSSLLFCAHGVRVHKSVGMRCTVVMVMTIREQSVLTRHVSVVGGDHMTCNKSHMTYSRRSLI